MNQVLINRLERIFSVSTTKKTLLLSVGILALDPFLILTAPLVSQVSSLLAVSLGWIWFILPGLALSYVLVKRLSWAERIPAAFILSIGLNTPASVLSILLRLSLEQYVWLVRSMLILSVFIFLLFRPRDKDHEEASGTSYPIISTERFKIGSSIFLLTVVIIAGYMAYRSSRWPPDGDDVSGLPIFQEIIRLGQITGAEPFHGTGTPSTPRNELIVWTYLGILIDKITHVTPVEYFMSTRPVLIVLAFLAFYIFIKQFFKDKSKALFMLSLWSIYLMATTREEGMGSNLITRIIQDKFLGWFVVVPTLLVFLLWFLESRDRRYLIGFALGMLGVTFVHPITFTQIAILGTGFSLLYLFSERRERNFKDVHWLVFILFLCLSILAIQYFRYQGRMPIEEAGLSDAVEFGRFRMAVSRYRLWLLEGGQFILHPSIILKPIILLGYAVLPIHFFYFRISNASKIILSSILLTPAVLYIPFLASLIGLIVTPFLLWRVAWPIELFAILSLGSAIWIAISQFEEIINKKTGDTIKLPSWAPILVVFLALAISSSNIIAGVVNFQERLSYIGYSPCSRASNLLSQLDELAFDHAVNVLASKSLNFCVPAFAALANVIEYRGFGTVNRLPLDQVSHSLQRVKDIDYFSQTKKVDQHLIDIVKRYDIDYMLVENDRFELNLQIRLLPDLFVPVLTSRDFTLYYLTRPFASPTIVAANTALRSRQWDKAERLLNQILDRDPKNVLALVGLGEVKEARGEVEQALASYQKASRYASNEPALSVRLAETYLLLGKPQLAINEYERALKFAPEQSSLHASLGRTQLLFGRKDRGRIALEKSVELKTPKGSAGYYTLLGRQYASLEMYQDAIAYYQEAIRVEPEPYRYVDLGEALFKLEKFDEAAQIYEKAIELDKWLYSPHIRLGSIYQSQGELEEAIREYETAWKLNPTYNSSFILLGQAIQEKSGLDEATEYLESKLSFNKVLPGPHIGLASLYAANGDYAAALTEYDFSSLLMPENATLSVTRAYLLLTEGKIDQALKEFNTAYFLNPDLISVQLGLSRLYARLSDFTQVAGQYVQILRAHPNKAWPHLMLADIYERQGKMESAEAEVKWALELDPKSAATYAVMGNLYKRRARWEDSISALEKALELDTQNSTYLLQLGEVYQTIGDFSSARKYFERALNINPKDITARQKLADFYWQQGEFEESIAVQEETFEVTPDSPSAWLILANSYRKQGRLEEANSLYQRAIQADPSLVAAYLAIAHMESENDGFQDTATELYQAAIEANPDISTVYVTSGKFFSQLGQFEEAENTLRIGLSIQNVTPDIYIALSELQRQRGLWEDALETLAQAHLTFPKDASVFVALGDFDLNAGEVKQAETYYQRAIEANPTYITAYVKLSKIAQYRGEMKQAQDILESAVANNPGSAEAYFELALLLDSKGVLSQSETYFQKAIEMAPSDVKMHIGLGQFYQRQNRFEEALEVLENARGIPVPSVDLYLALGELNRVINHADDAINWYQTAVSIDRSDSRPYIALANLYQTQRKWEAAITTLQTALAAQPSSYDINLAFGETYKKLNHFELAESHLQSAADLDRSRVSALVALGELYRSEGVWSKAIKFLRQAIDTSPTDLVAYAALGQTYQILGVSSTAREAFNQGIQNSLDQQSAFLARAAYFRNVGEWDLARSDYESAWDINPSQQSVGLQLATFHQQRREFEKAVEVLDRLEAFPNVDPQVYVEKGRIYSAQADWRSAQEAYYNAIRIDPSSAAAYAGLAQIYELQGDAEKALDLLKDAANNSPFSNQAFINLGNAYFSRLNYAEAYAAYRKAFEFNSEDVSVLENLFYLRRILGEQGDEIPLLLDRAKTAPTPELYIALAGLYQVRGDWDIAKYWYQRATDLGADKSISWLSLGNYYRSLHQWELALQAFKKGKQLDPTSSIILLAEGSVYEELGMNDRAIEIYQRSIEVDPNRIEPYVALASLESEIGLVDNALATTQTAIERFPGDYRGYQSMGWTLKDSGDFVRAEEAYQAGLDSMPGSGILYADLGDLYSDFVVEALVDLDTVQASFEGAQYRIEVLESYRLSANTREQRIVSELKLKDAWENYRAVQSKLRAAEVKFEDTQTSLEAAQAYYQMALQYEPRNPAAMLGLGRLNVISGSVENGVRLYEQATTANPRSTLALSYLADAYLELDQPNEAIPILQEILVQDPNNSFAHFGIARAFREARIFEISTAVSVAEHAQHNWDQVINFLRSSSFEVDVSLP